MNLEEDYCKENMIIRKYQPEDCRELAELFYDTVHTINAKDYAKEQLDAWADGKIYLAKWNQSFLAHYSLVAVEAEIIVGFGDIDSRGYLDRLFVHKDYQGQGVGAALCDRLERAAPGRVFTYASITAKGFFAQRGYLVVKKQQVKRQGILLTNFVMEKLLKDS